MGQGLLRLAFTVIAGLAGLAAAPLDAASLTLGWSDNSHNEEGFSVERSADGDTFAEIATVAANATEYVDESLVDGQTYYYRVRAYNEHGASGYSNVASGIAGAAPAPVVLSSSLPGGQVDEAYSAALEASGGEAPLSWSVASGALPEGLGLDAGSGALSGTPAQSGSFSFTVQVEDAFERVATKALSLSVAGDFSGDRVVDGLVAYYPLAEGAGALAGDHSGFGEPLGLELLGGASWLSDRNGVRFDGSGAKLQSAAAAKLRASLASSGAFTVEVWGRSLSLDQSGPARMLSYSSGTSNRNFTMGQEGGGLAMRLRSTGSGDSNGLPQLDASGAVGGGVEHYVATYDGANLRLYRNGVQVASESRSGELTNWDDGYVLVMGNETSDDRSWNGELYLAALYNRALSESDIQQNFAAGDQPASGGGSDSGGSPADEGQIAYRTPSGEDVLLTPQDVGEVGLAGETAYDAGAGTFSVTAAGQDIWSAADGFHFVWRELSGDFAAVVRVESLVASNRFAKAGLMVRDSLDPASIHGLVHVNEGGSLLFTRRPQAGAETTTNGIDGAAPAWLGLQRQGGLLVAYASADGENWTPFGSETLAFEGSVLVGLAATAHETDETAAAAFSGLDFLGAGALSGDAPTIGAIADHSVSEGEVAGPTAFSVADADTPLDSLQVQAASSNETLAPESSIILSGDGGERFVRVEPVEGATGEATITITVSDGESVASTSFLLTVTANSGAPTIIQPPSSLGVFVGEVASLEAQAEGEGTLEYQWRKDGEDIPGATGSIYLVDQAQPEDSGVYSVVVRNERGSVASDAATLEVARVLEIASYSVGRTVLADGSVELSVEASGDNLSYQWFRGESGDTSNPVPGATGATFTTPSLSETAEYWVRVTSSDRLFAADETAHSDTIVVDVVSGDRVYLGELGSGSDPFALLAREDGTAAMIAFLEGSDALVLETEIPLDPSAAFAFEREGLGRISGRLEPDRVAGEIEGLNLPFEGRRTATLDPFSSFAGFYQAVMLETSNGTVWAMVGGDGDAYVLASLDGELAAARASADESGRLEAHMPDGQTISLQLSASDGSVRGAAEQAGRTVRVSGHHEDAVATEILANTSVRAKVGEGSSVLIAGFVVGGSGSKRVLIRGVGPALEQFDVQGAVGDPNITLFRAGESGPVGSNDDWSSQGNAAEVADASQQLGAFALPQGSSDAAMLVDLPAGLYTAHVRGPGGGAALVELYDADLADPAAAASSRLVNLSMRGEVGSGQDVVIMGFVVSGNSPKRVLVRAVGPELERFAVEGILADPRLTLFKGSEPVVANDDWETDRETVQALSSKLGAFALDENSASAALAVWLEPGVYTAHAAGVGGSTGVALLEVYEDTR